MPYFATFDLFRLIEGEYSLVEYTITKDGTLLLALTDLALATDTDEQERRNPGPPRGHQWSPVMFRPARRRLVARRCPRKARGAHPSEARLDAHRSRLAPARPADRPPACRQGSPTVFPPLPRQALLARVQRAVDAQVERVLSLSSGIEPWIRADREVWELQRWQPFVGWGSSFPGHLYPGERRWVRRDMSKRTQAGFSTEGWRLDPTVVTADGWSYALVPQRLRARQVIKGGMQSSPSAERTRARFSLTPRRLCACALYVAPSRPRLISCHI
jgi:hypothetical protein